MSKLKSQFRPENIHNTVRITCSEGEWHFQQYKANIIKVAFHPKGYDRNEYLSDAVILKPFVLSPQTKKANALGIFSLSVNETQLVIEGPVRLQLKFFRGFEMYKGFQFQLEDQERIYGGGARAVSMNRRGHGFALYNAPHYMYNEGIVNLNYSVPFFTSSRGYGLLFDNPSRGYADIGKKQHDSFEYASVSGELNFYLITGTPQTILKTYHQLTGTQPLPPRWALGNFMSRFGYTSQKQVKQIATTMRREDFPFDAVILDLFWFGDSIQYTMGNLDWVNKEKWPAPKAMIDALKKENIQTVLITEPFVVNNSLHYNDSAKLHATDANDQPYLIRQFYFGEAGLLDIFKRDAQNWFWSKYKKQMRLGVEGWWGDLGEPENHPPDMFHDLSALGLKRKFAADEVHNLYGHTWTKFLFEKFNLDYPSKRLFSLNRSGFAGTQRYSIFPWSGDVERSWSGFRAQIPILLGSAMSGVPYMHADAGGFAGGEGDNELYVRWLQYTVFTPIFRPHGTALYEKDPNTFSYPSEPALFDEPYRSIVRTAVHRRYKLLPYNYTLAYRQTLFGEPLMQPLYFAFPSDEKAALIEDQFMWGNQILVAPVLHKGQQEREVYLPKGSWYRFGDNDRIEGGTTVTEQLTPADIPVFIKAGAIIPTAERKKIRTTNDCLNDILTWHYYPSDLPGSFDLFDDDGKTKSSLRNRQFELIRFAVTPTENGYRISVTSNKGSYRGKPHTRRMHCLIHSDKELLVKERNGLIRKTRANGKQLFSFNFSGEPVNFTVTH